jgi:hypothetical protein
MKVKCQTSPPFDELLTIQLAYWEQSKNSPLKEHYSIKRINGYSSRFFPLKPHLRFRIVLNLSFLYLNSLADNNENERGD